MRKIQLIPLLLLFYLTVGAQTKNISFDLASSAAYITPGQVPFWLRSNKFGSIPLDNASLSLVGAVHKNYEPARTQFLDWGASLEARDNIGHKSHLTLIERYGKLRLSVFELARSENEKQVMEVIAGLKSSVTIVFVTHRVSLHPWFDKVIKI